MARLSQCKVVTLLRDLYPNFVTINKGTVFNNIMKRSSRQKSTLKKLSVYEWKTEYRAQMGCS